VDGVRGGGGEGGEGGGEAGVRGEKGGEGKREVKRGEGQGREGSALLSLPVRALGKS